MIDGVHCKKIVRHVDGGSFFSELFKEGDPGFHTVAQTSFARHAPGTIKAFHYHDYFETWVVLEGRAHVVIYDNRPDSPTYKETQTIILDAEDPMALSIPSKIPHGYKVVSDAPLGILYLAAEAYDPSRKDQIGIIPEDDPEIGYNWNV